MRSQTCVLPDGATTVVEWHDEAGGPAKGVVAFVPALGVNAAFYRGLGEAWARRGWRVAVIEMRGMKQSSVRDFRKNNFGYDEILSVDLPCLMKTLSDEAAGLPFFMAGHSLGGQFALLHAARGARHPVDGVVLIAGSSNHFATLGSWPKRLRRRAGFRVIRLVTALLGEFPGHKLGFGGRQPSRLMRDWSHEGLTGRYAALRDGTDLDGLLATAQLSVLALSLEGDALVPRTSAEALMKKLPRAKVTQLELRARDFGLNAFGHFSWVKGPEAVLAPVCDWLDQRVVQGSRTPAGDPVLAAAGTGSGRPH